MGKAKRERAREKRDLEAERARQRAQQIRRTRRRALLLGGPMAVAVVVGIVLVSTLGGGASASGDGTSKAGLKLIAGVEQHGLTLGDPDAPVTVREFADLQCPVCKRFSEDVLPELLPEVKAGTIKIVYEPYAILGPDSEVAVDALFATVRENKAWSFIETFYANQGHEGSGYVTDAFLDRVASTAGMNAARMRSNIDGQADVYADRRAAVSREARSLGISSTPTIRVEGPGEATTLDDAFDVDAIDAAIDAAAGSPAKAGS